jgi:hypothetical protein
MPLALGLGGLGTAVVVPALHCALLLGAPALGFDRRLLAFTLLRFAPCRCLTLKPLALGFCGRGTAVISLAPQCSLLLGTLALGFGLRLLAFALVLAFERQGALARWRMPFQPIPHHGIIGR